MTSLGFYDPGKWDSGNMMQLMQRKAKVGERENGIQVQYYGPAVFG
jgi:hypothetical protein